MFAVQNRKRYSLRRTGRSRAQRRLLLARLEPQLPLSASSPTDILSVPYDAGTSLQAVHVPGDFATIQAAIDAAQDGDAVLIAPGVYHENLFTNNKAITLASHFLTEKDSDLIQQTVIDGDGQSVIRVDTLGATATTLEI